MPAGVEVTEPDPDTTTVRVRVALVFPEFEDLGDVRRKELLPHPRASTPKITPIERKERLLTMNGTPFAFGLKRSRK
jgi:hypothetical protein